VLSAQETTPETAVRSQLREIAGLGVALRERLLAAHGSLPVSPREDVMLLGEEDADFSTEMRRTIECVLADHLEPLIRALRTAAEYTPAGAEESGFKGGAMRTAIPPEVQWLRQALRSAVARSSVSRSQIEQELGLRAGHLDSILSGKAELQVAHLFRILHVLGLDFRTFLVLELRPPGVQAGDDPAA